MPATRIVCDSSSDGEYASTRQGTSDVTDFRKRNGGKETIREGTVLSFVQEACMYNNVVPFLVNIDDFHRLYLSVWNANMPDCFLEYWFNSVPRTKARRISFIIILFIIIRPIHEWRLIVSILQILWIDK